MADFCLSHFIVLFSCILPNHSSSIVHTHAHSDKNSYSLLSFHPLLLLGYPFTQHPEGAVDAIECRDPKAWGWLSVPFFLVVIILGAYVLPTVLVGIVSISFEEANKTAEVVEEMAKGVDGVVTKMQHDLPAFFKGGRMDRVCILFLFLRPRLQ
jgi:hypothetical protein